MSDLFEIGIPFVCFGMAIQLTSNATLVNQMCYLSPFVFVSYSSRSWRTDRVDYLWVFY